MVTGTKWWLEPRRAYFWVFAFLAWLATSPASLATRATWEGANVSGQVASHTSARLFLQGITKIPSGLLPSERAMPVGSRRVGIFAEASSLLRMLFTAACLGCRPWLLQLRLCKPKWSTWRCTNVICGIYTGQPLGGAPLPLEAPHHPFGDQ